MTGRGALHTGLLAAFGALLVAVACGEPEHPPPLGSDVGAGSAGRSDGGGILVDGHVTDGPPTCGGERVRAISNPPHLYFVLDRSGSMATAIDDSGVDKYRAAWRAVGGLLRAIGHRVEYGAALFPAEGADGCGGGARPIFPMTPGDAPGAVPANQNGPTLQALMNRFVNHVPGGPTPTQSALEELRPLLEALGERTFVVLATDGAPNCNEELTCTSAQCIPDIERVPFLEGVCGEPRSCCDETEVGEGAGANCIDAEGTVRVVRELFAAGIPTYVIGMPGSEAYAAVLASMAEAGGTARSGETAYYAISDQKALSDALFEIGTGIAIDCDLTLETAAPDPDRVNVYFDGEIVPSGTQGWQWTGEASLRLQGDACATLSSGDVLEVQIIYGCPTVVVR